ncbi:MAG: hypothetical protein RH917_05425 [Lacipirellulaceae bacterium]
MLNLALGYGLALYLGNPLASKQPAPQIDEERPAVASEEEIHKLLNDQVEESASDDPAQAELPEPTAVVEPTPAVSEIPIQASPVEPIPQASIEQEQEEVTAEVAKPQASLEPQPAPPTAEANGEPELTDDHEKSEAETPAPDIAAWQEQLREQAQKNQAGELNDTLSRRTGTIEEQQPTLEEFVGRQDQANIESSQEAKVEPEATEPEAEVLAGIEAFRDQLSQNLPQPLEPQSAEQPSAADAGSSKPAIPSDSPATDSGESEPANEEATPEETVSTEGEVENVDADVMAGIDAFRQQLAAMRGE